MQDVVEIADSVAVTVIKANRYGLGSFMFDAFVVIAILAVVYFGIKKVKRWKSKSEKYTPQQPAYLPSRY